MRHSVLLLLLTIASSACAYRLPYPVQPSDRAPVVFALDTGTEVLGTASLGWGSEHLVVNVRVQDRTPVFLNQAGVPLGEAYMADSVEFWVGRHQFALVPRADDLVCWDYLYRRTVALPRGNWRPLDNGYAIYARVPLAALGLAGKAGEYFQLALQVNDRAPSPPGETGPVVRPSATDQVTAFAPGVSPT